MAIRHVQPVEAMTFRLGTRRDGVVEAFPECTLRHGEQAIVWIDPTSLTGGEWLVDVDEEATSDEAAVEVSEIDVIMHLVAIGVDLSGAEGGEQVTVTCTIHPTAEQSIAGGLVINVT